MVHILTRDVDDRGEAVDPGPPAHLAPPSPPRADRLLRLGLAAIPASGLVDLVVGVVRPPDTDFLTLSSASAPMVAAESLLRILLTLCLIVAVVLGTGLYLRQRTRRTALLGPALVWLPGCLLLAITGLVGWKLAYRVDPQVVAVAVLGPVLVVLVWAAARRTPTSWFRPGEAAAIGLLLLVVAIGVGKATWSPGPDGELFGLTVARTLEPGDRSDSRLPFGVTSMATNGLRTDSPIAQAYFIPYSFSDRGPLAGLAAAPIVVGSGAHPPLTLPFHHWVPFDKEGFAAYRITLEVLAATVLLSAFGVLSLCVSRRAAWAGTVVLALTPFVIHEVYFTWPKLLATSFGLAALAALLSRRAGIAGLLLGLSYLAHPVGAFVTLGVVGIWLGLRWRERKATSLPAWALQLARAAIPLGLGALVFVVGWRLANVSDFHQGDRFGAYVFQANNVRPVAFSEWAASRLRSLGNTVVPFHMLVWDRDEKHLATIPTSGLVFDFQYWNTLPFAVGLVYFPAFVAGLVRFARRAPAVAVCGLVIPFVAFTLYWGSFVTGMMREGLHGWFVMAVLAAFLGHSLGRPSSRSRRAVRLLATARGIEVMVMLAAATIVGDELLDDGPFLLTDLVALTTMTAAVAGLTILTWRALTPELDDTAAPGHEP